MACLVEVRYADWSRKWTPEEQTQLQACSITPIEFRKDGELMWGTLPVMLPEDAARYGKYEVQRVVGGAVVQRLMDFGQRSTTVVNERCQVAVAGLGLLTVDTVQVEEDLCTDKLQALLDEGWRILAVCVQPDQRRPDYILGRSKGRQE